MNGSGNTKMVSRSPELRELHSMWQGFRGLIDRELASEDKWREMSRQKISWGAKTNDHTIPTGYGARAVLTARFHLSAEGAGITEVPIMLKIHFGKDKHLIYKIGDLEMEPNRLVKLIVARITNGLNEQKGVKPAPKFQAPSILARRTM